MGNSLQPILPVGQPPQKSQAWLIIFALICSNLFALFVTFIFEFLSLRGVVHLGASRIVLLMAWGSGVVAICAFVWGRGIRAKLPTVLGGSVLLALVLGALEYWTPKPPPQEVNLDAQHIQPELVIDSVHPLSYHISVLNIGSESLSDIYMAQDTSVVARVAQPSYVSPTLPSRGHISVPGSNSEGLERIRQVRVISLFKCVIGGATRQFLSSSRFYLPKGILTPQTIDPKGFFEATGQYSSTAQSALRNDFFLTISDAFSDFPMGTLEFWAFEKRPDGSPNYIGLSNEKRSFLLNPVLHTLWFRATRSSVASMATFSESNTRHYVAFTWDEKGTSLAYIDGKPVITQHGN